MLHTLLMPHTLQTDPDPRGRHAAVNLMPTVAAMILACLPAVSAGAALTNVTFVAFDLETTGLNPQTERIIEIGAVKFRNGKILEYRSWLINPSMRIPAGSTLIHGITDDMVAGAPHFDAVLPEFAAFAGDAILLAHNAGFDFRFLAAELERASSPGKPGNVILDTLRLARSWFPESKRHTIAALAEFIGLNPPRLHRALADADTLARIFIAGISGTTGLTTLEQLKDAAGKVYSFE